MASAKISKSTCGDGFSKSSESAESKSETKEISLEWHPEKISKSNRADKFSKSSKSEKISKSTRGDRLSKFSKSAKIYKSTLGDRLSNSHEGVKISKSTRADRFSKSPKVRKFLSPLLEIDCQIPTKVLRVRTFGDFENLSRRVDLEIFADAIRANIEEQLIRIYNSLFDFRPNWRSGDTRLRKTTTIWDL
uniref:Uncharacterized protein n=1 Tax=Vespula pensylvanica TaxID=30213 RepID=A0A834KWG1_VESPE|nr:hypothetical protein H0235_013037 [Vespula pensylvanica]